MTSVNPARQAQDKFLVASFYRFVPIAMPGALCAKIAAYCDQANTLGTIHIATEGVNATIAGDETAVRDVVSFVRTSLGTPLDQLRFSKCGEAPFRKMKVKQRAALINLGVPGVDPTQASGEHVSPEAWNDLINDPRVRLIDTRNDYEFRIGSFKGATNPDTSNFKEFPSYVEQALGADKTQPIAMFCTGGIRCEKASAYLLQQGYSQVYQLEGGILNYLESVPVEESQWQGDCFVFDDRIAVNKALERADYERCHGCRRPLSQSDLASPLYVAGIACAYCHDTLSPEQRQRFAERKRQIALAKSRQQTHLGPHSMPEKTVG